MPERRTLRRAAEDAREGKAASTQAGEFVREEIDHIRRGKHGARSTKQAIAIGLSKARRAGVKLKAPADARVAVRAERDLAAAMHGGHGISRRRSRATTRVLRHEGRQAAAPKAVSQQAKAAAKKRGASARSIAARKAARTRARAR